MQNLQTKKIFILFFIFSNLVFADSDDENLPGALSSGDEFHRQNPQVNNQRKAIPGAPGFPYILPWPFSQYQRLQPPYCNTDADCKASFRPLGSAFCLSNSFAEEESAWTNQKGFRSICGCTNGKRLVLNGAGLGIHSCVTWYCSNDKQCQYDTHASWLDDLGITSYMRCYGKNGLTDTFEKGTCKCRWDNRGFDSHMTRTGCVPEK